jgi:hypothetical protein
LEGEILIAGWLERRLERKAAEKVRLMISMVTMLFMRACFLLRTGSVVPERMSDGAVHMQKPQSWAAVSKYF